VGDQTVEGRAGRAGTDTALPVEAEQRSIGAGCPAVGPAALHLVADELGDARPVWNEAALAELAAPHDEQSTIYVDVADA
jgi:hypothetical protein